MHGSRCSLRSFLTQKSMFDTCRACGDTLARQSHCTNRSLRGIVGNVRERRRGRCFPTAPEGSPTVSPNLPGIFSVSRRCPDVLPEHRQQQTCTVAQACQQHHLQTYGSRVEPHHCTCWLCSWSQHKIPCQPAPKVPILALLRYAAYACCESTYMPSISHRIDPRALQHPAVQ
jgi:hypothetical protein